MSVINIVPAVCGRCHTEQLYTIVYSWNANDKRYIKENFLNYPQIIYLGWGGLAIVITIIMLEVNERYRAFTKFMYWLANIGIKKDGDKK